MAWVPLLRVDAAECARSRFARRAHPDISASSLLANGAVKSAPRRVNPALRLRMERRGSALRAMIERPRAGSAALFMPKVNTGNPSVYKMHGRARQTHPTGDDYPGARFTAMSLVQGSTSQTQSKPSLAHSLPCHPARIIDTRALRARRPSFDRLLGRSPLMTSPCHGVPRYATARSLALTRCRPHVASPTASGM